MVPAACTELTTYMHAQTLLDYIRQLAARLCQHCRATTVWLVYDMHHRQTAGNSPHTRARTHTHTYKHTNTHTCTYTLTRTCIHRYCPANVYEYTKDEHGRTKLQINAQNWCVASSQLESFV